MSLRVPLCSQILKRILCLCDTRQEEMANGIINIPKQKILKNFKGTLHPKARKKRIFKAYFLNTP